MGRKLKRSRIEDHGRECRICNEFKTWDAFYKTKGGARGYDSACRQCRKLIREGESTTMGAMEGFDRQRQDFINGIYKGFKCTG